MNSLCPNFCAICLDPYKFDDIVVWSSSPDCRHVFHQECLVEGLSRAQSNEAPCPCCRCIFCDMQMERRRWRHPSLSPIFYKTKDGSFKRRHGMVKKQWRFRNWAFDAPMVQWISNAYPVRDVSVLCRPRLAWHFILGIYPEMWKFHLWLEFLVPQSCLRHIPLGDLAMLDALQEPSSIGQNRVRLSCSFE